MANETQKRKKLPRYTTPVGVLVYPRVSAPGQNYNKDGMEYSTKIKFAPAEAKKLRKDFAPIIAEAVELGRAQFDAMPINTRKKIKGGFKAADQFGDDLYDDDEKATGEVQLKFARKAAGVSKKTGKPWSITLPVFDAKGNPMKGVDVWGGSEAKLTFEYEPYFIPGTGEAGLSKRLLAVQIIKLVTKGEVSAGTFGFDAEDGYEFDPADAQSAADELLGGSDAADGDENPDF